MRGEVKDMFPFSRFLSFWTWQDCDFAFPLNGGQPAQNLNFEETVSQSVRLEKKKECNWSYIHNYFIIFTYQTSIEVLAADDTETIATSHFKEREEAMRLSTYKSAQYGR